MYKFNVGDVVEITKAAHCRIGKGEIVGMVEPHKVPPPDLLDLYAPYNRDAAIKPMSQLRVFVKRIDSGVTVVFPMPTFEAGLQLAK
jgi:hypothetical protein